MRKMKAPYYEVEATPLARPFINHKRRTKSLAVASRLADQAAKRGYDVRVNFYSPDGSYRQVIARDGIIKAPWAQSERNRR